MSTGLVKEARKGGVLVATLRCVEDADGASVEAEVLPAGGSTPVPRGPYRFATAQEASRFVQEATLALEYLDCSVNSG